MKITKLEFLEHLMVASHECRHMYHEEKEDVEGNKYVAKGYEIDSWDMQLCIQERLADLEVGLFEKIKVCELKEKIRKQFGTKNIQFIIDCLRIIDERKDIIVNDYDKRVKENEKLMEELQEIRNGRSNILSKLDSLIMGYMPDVCKRERELTQDELDALNKYIEKSNNTSIEEVIELNDKLLDEFLIDIVIGM